MPEITFHSKGIKFKFTGARKASQWLIAIARAEGKELESLTYVFTTDRFLSEMNEEFLSHRTLTDILTFDYSESKAIVGEIYISVPRVRENAMTYSQPFEQELKRVMSHGLLHLLGYRDKTPRQSAVMRRKEEACLSLWA